MESVAIKKGSGIKVLFSFKSYLLLLVATAISRLGDSVDSVAYGWLVYQFTGSKLLMGALFATNAVPNIIFSPFAGTLVDKLSKKKVVVLGNIGRGLVVSTTALLYFTGKLEVYHLFILTFLNSTLESFVNPATASILPMLLDKEQNLSGNSFYNSTKSFAELIGLAFAGVIISLVGTSGAILFDGITFFIAGAIFNFIRIFENVESLKGYDANQYFKDFKEGFVFIKNDYIIFISIILMGFTNFCISPINVLQTAYVKDILLSGPEMLSIMGIGLMIGTISGGLLVAQIGQKFKISTLVISGISILAVCYALLSMPAFFNLNPIISSILATLLFSIMGFSIPLATSPIMAYILSNTPKEILCRVISVMSMVCMCAIPLASAITGALSEIISIQIIFLTMGILLLLVTLLLTFDKNFKKM